jgi:hypothetical protein
MDEFEGGVFDAEMEERIKTHNLKHAEVMDVYYAELTKRLLVYVLNVRESNPDEPLVQIITQWCFENDLDPALVGDAISQDFYFKRYIENDCKAYSEYRLDGSVNEIQFDEW